MRTAALVGADGVIDFLCLPEFDSPTVFARLLDAERGGAFTVAPAGSAGAAGIQRYVRDTNVLVTRFATADGELELVDFMAARARQPVIVRLVRALRGKPRVHMRCAPRFDYARGTHSVEPIPTGALFASATGNALRLTTSVPVIVDGLDARADVELAIRRKPVAFMLELLDGKRSARPMNDREARRALRQTIVFWRRWISRCTSRGEWRTAVRRSALTLKLLQSRTSGAVIAAPTFGLPEQIGGSRNWDFRYAWVRDASYTVYALVRAGLASEARAFTDWIVKRSEEADSPGVLRSLYGVDGRPELTETTLDHLEGYRGSRPVRVGNAAYGQLQLDIYGELMDTLHIADAHGMPMSRGTWTRLVEVANWVCANWHRPDQGIWEVRGGAQEFLFSRVMCWVALDRALRLARRHRLATAPNEWRITREAIRADIEGQFWNEQIGAYVGTKGSASVDAACLVMPLVRFIDGGDARWRSTLRVVEERLVHDWLVRRYDMDGMDTDAGSPTAPAFTILSFWYIECLARSGQVERARAGMRRMLAYANQVGLFAEDIAADGTQVGNFPQGLVHAALVGAAFALDRPVDRPAR